MRTAFDILVVGDVPEALRLPGHEMLPELRIRRAAHGEDLLDLLETASPDMVVTTADAGGVDLVRQLKSRWRFMPVVMVADPEQADEVLRAHEVGLDEKLIRCSEADHTVDLLALTVLRCLEYFTPGSYSSAPGMEVALHHAVYANVTESVLVVGPRGRVVYFNRAANDISRELSGVGLRVGQPTEEYLSGDLSNERSERIRRNLARAFEGHRTVVREEMEDTSARPQFREYTYAPVRDHQGGIIAASITSRDIGEVRIIEEKLEESEARFWQFFENLPVGVSIVSPDGTWSQVNPGMQEILGYSRDELVGKSPVDFTHPDDVEATNHTLQELFEGHRGVIRLQKRLFHKDGHTIWCDITGIGVRANHGPVDYVLGIVSDITLRRYLEEQLQDTEKMRMVGQLAGGIAHDFNNLLTIITSYTHHVLTTLGEQSSTAFALNKVMNAAQRGSSLTDQLLAFSRRQLSQPTSVDLNLVIEEVREMLERVLHPYVELDVVDQCASTPVWIDRGQLDQVIFNLVMNARDAMPAGGTLTIELDRLELSQPRRGRLEEVAPGSYGVLVVRDTGGGIAPDVIDHIFEPFFTTKDVGQGTGLGLASTWGIVKQARGYIELETTVGEGTTFTIYLPRSETAPVEPPSPGPGPVVEPGSRATVLLVEDDVDVREALRRFLDRRGFQVLEASSGAEALECAQEYPDIIDILLSDVVMPGMSGQELADALHAERPDTCIFLMSAYPGALVDEGERTWPVLAKPLDLEELGRLLHDALKT